MPVDLVLDSDLELLALDHVRFALFPDAVTMVLPGCVAPVPYCAYNAVSSSISNTTPRRPVSRVDLLLDAGARADALI